MGSFESSVLTDKPPGTREHPGSPYCGPGLAARAGPFAAVAVVAEASLALPPGPSAWPVAVSVVLLLATGLEFLLPWPRLPRWLPVLVPLTYTGSVLALILAAGPSSGVGIVVLIPLIWTVLFGARLESGCVVVAVVAVEVITSLTPAVASGAVIARRVLLWAALGVLISVATHGLRDRVRHAQEQRALLQDQLRELTVLEDRDRIAADLRDGVIQRIFAAGLTLQGAAGMTTDREIRRRVESAAGELDQAVQILRDTIFGMERRLRGRGFRAELLSLCDGLSPAPEVGFIGPVDGALEPGSRTRLVDLLRESLAHMSTHAEFTRIDVTTSAESFSTVAEARLVADAAETAGPGPGLPGLRSMAAQAGVHIEIQEIPGGIRLAWHVPLGQPLSVAGL